MKSFYLLCLLSYMLVFISCNPIEKKAALNADTSISAAENTGTKINTDWFSGHEHDADHFAAMYPVSHDNPFLFASYDELLTHLKWGTGIVVFGFTACPRCRNVLPVLEKAFREMNMERYAGLHGKILYYDIYDDREADNERYKTIVSYVKDYLKTDDNGDPRIYSPDVFFLSSGRIVGNHQDTVSSLTNPRDSLNNEQEAELLAIYKALIEETEDCDC